VLRTPATAEEAVKNGFTLPLPPVFGYTSNRAVVVVEGATVTPFVTEATTMLVIGLILSVFGIGLFCWLIFMLAVYALPFFVLCGWPHKTNRNYALDKVPTCRAYHHSGA